METADGQRSSIGDVLEAPSRAGTYFLTRNGRRVGALVVNGSAAESQLEQFTANELTERLHAARSLVAPNADAWSSMAFRGAARRSLLEPALLVALVLLAIEAVLIGARPRRMA